MVNWLRGVLQIWVQHPTGGSNSFPPEQHTRVLENTVHPQGEGCQVVRCPALHSAASSTGAMPKKKRKKKKKKRLVSLCLSPHNSLPLPMLRHTLWYLAQVVCIQAGPDASYPTRNAAQD